MNATKTDPTLQTVAEWLTRLPGQVTIQEMKNGYYLFALSTGDISLSIIRPTFIDAARVCMEQVHYTSAAFRAAHPPKSSAVLAAVKG